MKYVIVAVVRGEAGEMNNRLRKKVFEELGARSSTLPAHFTIKAPFEYEGSIEGLKQILKVFVKEEKAEPFHMKGYNHFDRRVIYMDVEMSKEGRDVHDRLIDVLSQLSYIQFDKKDGKDKVFHVTVSSKRIMPIYDVLWDYVQQYPCDYKCMFDNISLYKWQQTEWVLEEMFELKE